MQTDVTDFIGAVRPVASVKPSHTLQDTSPVTDTSNSLLTPNTNAHSVSNSNSNVQFIPVDVDDMADSTLEPNNILEWVDGPLIQAMRQGAILLIDEINLASDNILERLNSVLEFEKTITL